MFWAIQSFRLEGFEYLQPDLVIEIHAQGTSSLGMHSLMVE